MKMRKIKIMIKIKCKIRLSYLTAPLAHPTHLILALAKPRLKLFKTIMMKLRKKKS